MARAWSHGHPLRSVIVVLEKIKFNSKPSGKTLPLEEEKKDFYLDDFKIISKRSYQEKKGVAKGESPNGR